MIMDAGALMLQRPLAASIAALSLRTASRRNTILRLVSRLKDLAGHGDGQPAQEAIKTFLISDKL